MSDQVMQGCASEVFGVDRQRARDVRVLVLTGYGLNCEAETAAGFTMVGADVTRLHASEVFAAGDDALQSFHILAFIGGFSFGDHIASGRVYANRLRFRLGERLSRFLARGGLAIGICNGFQTMVKLGILPGRLAGAGADAAGLPPQSVSLVHNERLGYRDAWVRLLVDPDSPCLWTRGLRDGDGRPTRTLEVPCRHGEGRLVYADAALERAVQDAALVPVRYVDGRGRPTERWPDNPNGSPGGAAGLCDRGGRLFGLMPHPEAFLYPESHPRWLQRRDAGTLPRFGAGLGILACGVRAAIEGA